MQETITIDRQERRVEYERRRYGRTTYTWAHVLDEDGDRVSLGDPWPGVRWPRADLIRAAEAALIRAADEAATTPEEPTMQRTRTAPELLARHEAAVEELRGYAEFYGYPAVVEYIDAERARPNPHRAGTREAARHVGRIADEAGAYIADARQAELDEERRKPAATAEFTAAPTLF